MGMAAENCCFAATVRNASAPFSFTGCLSRFTVQEVLATNKREFDMRLGKYLLAAAAASMTVAPAIAANPAASLSVAQPARAGSVTADQNEAVGGGILVAILAAAAVIVGIIIIADSDDDPDSP